MSMHVAQGRLQQVTKELLYRWSETEQVWNDPASRNFEKQYLGQLEGKVRAAVNAMEVMGALMQQARSECR